MPGRSEPRAIGAVLGWRGTWFLARIALGSAYVLGGVVKLVHWQDAVAEQAHFGMHPPTLWAALTILVELIGPALLFSNRWTWLGAGMLGVFTGLAAITANAFWTMQGEARFAATNAFFEHLGLIGGFALAALVARAAQLRDQR